MKMIWALLTSTVLIGCGSGGGGAGAGPRAFDATPAGFQATGAATKPDPTIPNSRFSVGCITPGSSDSLPTNIVDPRLQVGQQFNLEFESLSFTDGYARVGGVQQITAVTSTSLQSVIHVTEHVNFPAPPVINESCTRTAPDQSGYYGWTCDTSKIAKLAKPASLIDGRGDEKGCSINSNGAGYEQTEVPGIYMGRKAYWLTWKTSGEIICNGISKGPGSMTSNTVVSNQVPAQGIHYCGGTDLFNGYELKTEKNIVLESSRLAITQAPLVSE